MSKVLLDGEGMLAASSAITSISLESKSLYDAIVFQKCDPSFYNKLVGSRLGGIGNDEGSETQNNPQSNRNYYEEYNKLSMYDALLNIVYAIILWDDIYVLDEPFNSHFLSGLDYFKEFGMEFRKIHINRDMSFGPVVPEVRQMILDCFYEYSERGSNDSVFGDRPSYSINRNGARALNYLFVANTYDLDYIPSLKRQVFLEEYNFMRFFNRGDVIEKLDKELAEYYNSIASDLKRTSIRIKFPVILDYLMKRYNSIEDVIKASFDLKYEGETIRFRRELDQVNKYYSDGNFKSFSDYFHNIHLLIEDLTSRNKIDSSIDVTISFPPSITFTYNKQSHKPFQSVFLKDLAYYGITERRAHPKNDIHLIL